MRRYQMQPVGEDFVDTAPARFVNSVLIDASAAAVWAALEDPATWPRWAKAIKHVEWTSAPPFGIGTTRTVRMTGKMTVFEEFIVWEPQRRMGFRFNEATMNGVSAFAELYTLDAISPTQTRVSWVMAMQPSGVSRAIVPVTLMPMRRLFGHWLRGFKHLVEREYQQAMPRNR
ncbi:MAG TPA: SRPBCC family protein [Jatrophihabitantaceae bacterium]